MSTRKEFKMYSISILVVEDEAMTAMFMETMLKRKGYNVLECVASGEEAVDCALQTEPDVIIMDIRLAGKMDGIEAALKIKAGSEKTIQFIFATGYSDSELKEKAMELEPLVFCIKPINLPVLVNVINSFFIK